MQLEGFVVSKQCPAKSRIGDPCHRPYFIQNDISPLDPVPLDETFDKPSSLNLVDTHISCNFGSELLCSLPYNIFTILGRCGSSILLPGSLGPTGMPPAGLFEVNTTRNNKDDNADRYDWTGRTIVCTFFCAIGGP